MAGIRTYTTLDPNIWRFPRWKNDTVYFERPTAKHIYPN